ncbi:cytokine receptor family member b2 isoform X2 [Nerophis ophidion]|uniref:cytokine receptor family member b2 isoform X2 n=1 Tax=Nerophis ophidion TaxID=159077 RepID=UPI002AE0509D|nr:cytokine receptor family member b2 isoform X2 [Nerophis ophidion]
MIIILWMMTSLLYVLTAMSELPQPVNIALTSNNFIHMLTWEPGLATPEDVYYQVFFITDTGIDWIPVASCQHVQQPLVCNMTKAFSNPSLVYITQVVAKLGHQASLPTSHPAFQPIKDTYLDLPLMTVAPCGHNVCVELQPPMPHLRDFYEPLSYQLRVKSSDAERELETKSLKRVTLENLAPGLPIFTVLCIIMIIGVITIILLVYTGFICRRKRPVPRVLTSVPHIEEVLLLVPQIASLSSFLEKAPVHCPDEEVYFHTPISRIAKNSSENRNSNYKTCRTSKLLCGSLSSFEQLPGSSMDSNSGTFPLGFSSPQAQVWDLDDTSSNAASQDSTANRDLISDFVLDLDQETLESMELESGGFGETDNQNVNLLTLVLGRNVEENEEKSFLDQSDVERFVQKEHDTLPVTASEDPLETIPRSVEDEDEQSVYMRRPSPSFL